MKLIKTIMTIVFLCYLSSLALAEQNGAGVEWEKLIKDTNELRGSGDYDQAVIVAKKAIEVAENAVGPDHPDVAHSLVSLAFVYSKQRRYDLEEPLYKRSLAIMENALGSDHPDVANSLTMLARFYFTRGNYEEAEPLYKRSLAIMENALGPDSAGVVNSLNDLAQLYFTQKQYVFAEPLYKRSLAIVESWPEKTALPTSLYNLANLYRATGRPDEAEELENKRHTLRQPGRA
jgi:tetratricopeptide (TPR) repeat protein